MASSYVTLCKLLLKLILSLNANIAQLLYHAHGYHQPFEEQNLMKYVVLTLRPLNIKVIRNDCM